MMRSSSIFRPSLLAVSVSTILLSGCLSSDSDSNTSDEATPAVTGLTLEYVGRYSSDVFGESAAEITGYDPASRRAFVVNANEGSLNVLDMNDPSAPTLLDTLTVEDVASNAVVNSVAVQGGLVAVAIEASPKTEPGYAAIYDAATLSLRGFIGVGAQPDMLTFTPDGNHLLVANEGEPSDNYQTDPEGSVSVIDVSDPDNLQVRTADFTAFNGQKAELVTAGIRVFGPGASVAMDLEPEYITVSDDSATAWAALQENNALAKVDIATATVTEILPLGYKDHGLEGQGLDASDEKSDIDIKPWPGLLGMYHPDAITSYSAGGETYILTANEGDARAWGEDTADYWGPEDPALPGYGGDATQGFVEELRFKHLFHKDGFARRLGDDMPPQLYALAKGALLNPEVFDDCGASAGDPGLCREDEQLGRLSVTWTMGYRTDDNGDPVMFDSSGTESVTGDRLMYDQVYSFGARSMAIWTADGDLVWDSGDMIEQFLASDACFAGSERDISCADFFNSNHDEGDAFLNRSDNKGPEPEAVTVATFGDRTFAFLGLERMGGVMAFDVTNPESPSIVDYLNTREDWVSDPETNLAIVGDLGIEDITVIPADQSPTGDVLMLTGNEVSGTTAVYRVVLQTEE
ncbi:choice-of-anchor I family protein [Marinobacter sp. 2_MG-2023]|uniref:choice-of-anchor I family protein n=1 Tax=Marinobacter sp. 2_MG-2023 TaxID=3062679 RepID=UPI0026E39DE5|nr:choice-of-anchor I family protein [Marinobacter sp. 2_MG-2023]MDO6441369.1 choice-of-anchor I family protein [Marinobacter sp. 2_MG-2023]